MFLFQPDYLPIASSSLALLCVFFGSGGKRVFFCLRRIGFSTAPAFATFGVCAQT